MPINGATVKRVINDDLELVISNATIHLSVSQYIMESSSNMPSHNSLYFSAPAPRPSVSLALSDWKGVHLEGATHLRAGEDEVGPIKAEEDGTVPQEECNLDALLLDD